MPTTLANGLDLAGQARFSGGTGLISDASGSTWLSGTGVFSDATTAVASLRYSGSIALLPEPGNRLLLSADVAALALRGRRRPRQDAGLTSGLAGGAASRPQAVVAGSGSRRPKPCSMNCR